MIVATPDQVYIPSGRIGWWGGLDIRPRCKRTDKVVFQTEAHAEYSAARVREREAFKQPRKGGRVMMAYQCKDCGQWHVGHGKRKPTVSKG